MKSRAIDLVAPAFVVAAWIVAAHSIPTLPERIPTHFGLSGAADATGPAASLWTLPITITGVYLFLNAIPNRLSSYPVPISDRNREGVQALGRELLGMIRACTVLTLLVVEWGAIDAASRGSISRLFPAAILTPLVLLVAIAVWYIQRMRTA